MLTNENYLHEIHTIQISTCKRLLSICFGTREILLKFVDTDHLLTDKPITFKPDYYSKIRISIENIPIELPDCEVKEFLSTYTKIIGKTCYPGIKHSNKYFTTGTRIYQCIKINHHIPRRIFHFGRYLRIRYDEQPQDTPHNNDNEHHNQKTYNNPQLSEDEQQTTDNSQTSEDKQQATEDQQSPEDEQRQIQK